MDLGEYIKMTDIKTSREISKWLDDEGITFEVDEFAPVVWKNNYGGIVDVLANVKKARILCPFFGPGGADNCLKALRAWCEKRGKELVYGLTNYDIHWWIAPFDDQAEQEYFGSGKTDGIALHDLLYKLRGENK